MRETTARQAAPATQAAQLTAIQDSFAGILTRWAASGMQDVIIARAGVSIDAAAMALLHILIRAGGSARPSYLAQQSGTGASNVSKVLARMETQGLVERTTDPADQRAVSVTVTRAGIHVQRSIRDTSNAMLSELLHDWSPADVQQFSTLLSRYSQALQEAVFP